MILHRPATLADVPALADLIESAYRGPRSQAGWTTEAHLLDGQRTDAASLADSLADPQNIMLMAEDDHGPLACVMIESRADHGYIGMVTVRPTAQGAGLGRQLLASAEDHIRAQCALPRARMTVIAQRAELIAWYARRGYHNTGETAPFPYGDARFGAPKQDDLYFIILEKTLP